MSAETVLQETGTMARFATEVSNHSSFFVDVGKLVETRALINANSGGGKSYLIRKLLEATHGKVQQVVLDLEGEFYTLREKYDYLLVGKKGLDAEGADIGIDLRTAELLARTILENAGTSVIVDLSELKEHERKRYVRLFLESLVEAPKDLRHPLLVVVDEAHHFCPEKGKGEAESEPAVIDLMTRGRKRGLCGVLATQRLSKLNKDAAAECNNVLTGRTTLEADQAKAADILGFKSKEQATSLRDLEAGQFYAFGPAFERGVNLIQVDPVKTTHIRVGMNVSTLPLAASEKIKSALSRFSQVNPEKAEVDLKDRQATANEISRLRRELTIAKSREGSVSPDKIKQVQDEAFERGRRTGSQLAEKNLKVSKARINRLTHVLQDVAKRTTEAAGMEPPKFEGPKAIPAYTPTDIHTYARPAHAPVRSPVPQVTLDATAYGEERPLKSGARRMLTYAKQFDPRPISREQVAALSGFSARSGTFGDYLSQLKKKKYLTEDSQGLHITQAGSEFVGDVDPLSVDPQQLVEMWASKFKAGAARMLRIVAGKYPDKMSREELGQESGFSAPGGTFGDYLSQLTRCGLVVKENGDVRASPNLFMEEQLA